jgi:hypothetical protein
MFHKDIHDNFNSRFSPLICKVPKNREEYHDQLLHRKMTKKNHGIGQVGDAMPQHKTSYSLLPFSHMDCYSCVTLAISVTLRDTFWVQISAIKNTSTHQSY